MSTAYQGNYSNDLFNASKRYRLMYQKSVALADSELREEQSTGDSFVRQLISNNYPTGSSTNNGFQVIESSISNVNNFTIKGGDGTVNGAGVLFVDGYMLFLKGDIEIENLNSTGALTDDDFTETSLPALTTPGAPRTDEVYVDFYFAEVSSTVGSEYLDSSLTVTGIGSTTANRSRAVQDVRVAEGGVTPASGTDGNGIYHWRIKIATLNRLNGDATITTAMITDDRTLINSVESLATGTTQTDLVMTDGQNIGDATHGVGTLYMASTIDYGSDLTFESGGEKIRFTTGGNIGIGTDNPQENLHIFGTTSDTAALIETTYFGGEQRLSLKNGTQHWSVKNKNNNFLLRDETNTSDTINITPNAKYLKLTAIGLGVGTTPTTLFHVGPGTTTLDGDLDVNGSTTTINTEIVSTDKITINQDENESALDINKTAVGVGNAVEIDNAGTGAALIVTGSGNNTVGIGTTAPETDLEIYNSNPTIKLRDSDDNDAGVIQFQDDSLILEALFNNGIPVANIIIKDKAEGAGDGEIYFSTKQGAGALTTRMFIGETGLIGIGTTNPSEKLDVRSGNITISSVNQGIGIGTDLGAYRWYADDDSTGEGLELAAEINYKGTGTWNSGSSPANIEFKLKATADVLPDTKMVIAHSGNVGIGTEDPQENLHIFGTTSDVSALIQTSYGGGQARLSLINDAQHWSVNTNTLDSFIVRDETGAGDIIKIEKGATFLASTSTGLGVGTSSPQAKLHVWGDIVGKNDDTSNLGSAARRWSTVYMASTIDYASDLAFSSSGEKIRFTTAGSVGVGLTSPQSKMHIHTTSSGTNNLRVTNVTTGTTSSSGTIFGIGASENAAIWNYENTYMLFGTNNSERMRILADGKVGIGTVNPQTTLHVNGATRLDGDLDVNGSTTTINTETVATDKITINQDENEVALDINKTATGVGNVVEIANAGSGHSLTIDAGNVGVGTTDPQTMMQIRGGTLTVNDTIDWTVPLAKTTIGVIGSVPTLQMYDPSGDLKNQLVTSGDNYFTAKLGIGTNTPKEKLHVWKSDSGQGTVNDNADELVLETSGNTGMTILCPSSSSGSIYWGDESDDDVGRIQYSHSTNSMRFHINAAQRMVIDGNGAVGIGTSDPKPSIPTVHVWQGDSGQSTTDGNANGLIIEDDNNTGINILTPAANSGNIWFGDSGNNGIGRLVYNHPDNSMQFYTSSNEQMRINSAGNVGIGTNAPKEKFHIWKSNSGQGTVHDNADELVLETSSNTGMTILSGTSSTGNIYFGDSGNNGIGKLVYSHSNNSMQFYTANAEQMRINSTGQVGIGTSPITSLHVMGSILSMDSTDSDATIKIATPSDVPTITMTGAGGNTKVLLAGTGNSYINGSDLGIGTNDPLSKLHVLGNARIQNPDDADSQFVFSYPSENTQLSMYSATGIEGVRLNSIEDSFITRGNVGIGTSFSMKGKLHVSTDGVAIPSVASEAGELVLEGIFGAGMTIASRSSETGNIYFADEGSNSAGKIVYNHDGNIMSFYTANDLMMTVLDRGSNQPGVGIGTVTPTTSLHVRGGAIRLEDSDDSDNRVEMSTANNVPHFRGYAPNGDKTIDLVGDPTNTIESFMYSKLGIGTDNPSGELHIYEANAQARLKIQTSSTSTDARLIFIEDTRNFSCGVSSTLDNYFQINSGTSLSATPDFRMDASGNCTANSFSPFTGSHNGKIDDSFGEYELGMIVETTGNVDKDLENICHSLNDIKLVSKEKQKTVFGVIAGIVQPGKEEPDPDEDDLLRINALGDGLILITNYNGDIENGDLITSSLISGYGQKQDDDLFHNYTVAKLTENVDWDNIEETIDYDGNSYKKVLAACTYHCG